MTELDPKERARIASQAQAAAHKALREAYLKEYRDHYQKVKDALTARAERRLRET